MRFDPELINGENGDFGSGDFFCCEAIVAKNDDPENRNRVQLVIPIIDESAIHEVWARRMQLHVGEDGFGDYFVPALGAEVVVIGRLGDTNHLFYAPLWNESRKPAADFSDPSKHGARVSSDLLFFAELLAKVQARNIELVAEQVAKILAPNVDVAAEQMAKVKGDNVTLEAMSEALLKGNQVNINGAALSIESDGSLSITGGNVTISGDVVRIQNRIVNKVGPAI